MTHLAKRYEINQIICLLVAFILSRDIPKLTKRADMVNIQGALYFGLSRTAVLTVVLVALACGALLRPPVWAIVALIAALPIGCIFASAVLRLPYSMTFAATALRCFRWLSQKHGAAYPTWCRCSFRHARLFAEYISTHHIAKVARRTLRERGIAPQLFATRCTQNNNSVIVVVLALIAAESMCSFAQFVSLASDDFTALLARDLSFTTAPTWISRAYMYARLHYTHAQTRAAMLNVLVNLRLLAIERLLTNTAINLWHRSALSGVLVACLELTMRQKGPCVVYHIPASRQAPDTSNYTIFRASDQVFTALGGETWRL